MKYLERGMKVAKDLAKNYYNFKDNKNIFKCLGMDLEDLTQECNIVFLKVSDNPIYKDYEEEKLFKVVYTAIEHYIKTRMKKGIDNMGLFPQYDSLKHNEEDNREQDTKFEQENVDKKPRINWSELKSLLNNRDYMILHGKIINNSTFEDIAKELDLTAPRVNQIYNKLLVKLRDYFQKSENKI